VINNKYPNPIVQKYEMSESVMMDKLKVTVLDYQWLDEQEIIGNYPDLDIIIPDNEIKSLFITLSFENTGVAELLVESYYYTLESFGWCNGANLELFHEINDDESNMRFYLQAEEKCTLVLPYTIVSSHFSKNNWKDIRETQFDLTLSLYPIKKSIKLNYK